jgi:hypothetical protein
VQRARAEATVGAALALALHAQAPRGTATLHAPPGEPVSYTAGPFTIRPFEVCGRLTDGSLGGSEWATQCAATGLAGVDLGAVARTACAPRAPSRR